VNVSSHSQTVVLCDEETRAQIQEMRGKLLGAREGRYHNHEPDDPRITDAEFVEEEREERES
jgi:hypothetical protein